DVMVPLENVVTLTPGDALHKVVAVIRRTGHNGFPVLDKEGKLVGVVTHEDTRNAQNRGDLFVKAEDLMTRDMVTVTPYETGEEALRRMGDRRVSHLPVVDPYDSTKLMGWLSKGDLVFAYDDYHRRMEAPITDETVEAATEGEGTRPEPTEEALEEVLKPPSFMARVFGRKGRKGQKVPADKVEVVEVVEVAETEVVVIERERPVPPPPAEEPKVEPEKKAGPVHEEESEWEEGPAEKAEPARKAKVARETEAEWVETPPKKAKLKKDEVEKVGKRSL
ncbi:MAG: CBS domain-containing protein, partial [Thermoplasmata archaeon]|nr:CBS domain-containing protein [Thermoplasmata archaeon]